MSSIDRTRLSDDDRMPFGVHEGIRLGDVPDVYWRWFLGWDRRDGWPDLVEYANLVDDDD